jgi:protein-S-isoprenylcysteine O-methyltransferase Ste14
MAKLVLRAVVWIGAFLWLAYLKKPAGASFADIRPGAPGLFGLGLVAAGAGLWLWSMLWLDRVVRGPVAASTPPLVTGGPYGYVRNPLYLAAAVIGLGIATLYAPWSGAAVGRAIVIVLLAHAAVVRLEEPRTLRNLGPIYEEYCRRVPRWIPGLAPAPPGRW